ncbi:tRNA mo(5)U34 methyltransferase [Psychromonas sp. CNPT3]|uniref:tRNA 5-methoxyuridine(34)/uridine 5-oxyacetic acid(34) synthase CmoB n=1 Tax=Psychromonas sp. CNPT3 TaxID=314282 RepID=UPI00006E483F|nr:tRNA 5-methoxyuridine(34)/uridine 5-oxyacetic acid(34) synthase CmoB [Psychromonas sp. CNPT3]AGH81829.1 tRNA mo(5)U34 methyltransferase [Psychromonas sp. CNPT3]
MIDFTHFYSCIANNRLSHWLRILPEQLHAWESAHVHGKLAGWIRVLNKLPEIDAAHIELKTHVEIGKANTLSLGETKKLENLLQKFHPWRKGPFDIHGVHIDTEWRSDWKWDRVLPHISPLKYRYVLDVGCGSGYHMWRMRGEGAKFVVGIDPSDLFLCQFEAVRHFANKDQQIHLLPLGIQQLPKLEAFDSVFSMGVLYHRKSPMDHITQLQDQLVEGGELILETLVIDGDKNDVLVPEDRYAKMRNIWFLPSALALKLWVEKCGFENVRIVDINDTLTGEQRSTAWMTNESLQDYLDPLDPTKTIEGHPAPKRALLIATKAFKTLN